MRKHIVGLLGFVLILGLNAPVVLAYHCPKLVDECNALTAKLEKREGTDKAKLAEAKKDCAEALELHKAGKHKDAIINAGDGIVAAGEAAK